MIVNRLGFFEGTYIDNSKEVVVIHQIAGSYRPFDQKTGETADSNMVEIRYWRSGILDNWIAYLRYNNNWEIGDYKTDTGFIPYTKSVFLNWLKDTVVKAIGNADNTNSVFITELPKS